MTKTKKQIIGPAMTPTAFKRWLRAMGYNHSEAARNIGVSRNSVIKYLKTGAPLKVKLACETLARD